MIKKNFLLLVRNWPSFLLLIIGPFMIMLLIGMVFSHTAHAGVSLGVVSTNTQTQEFFDELIQGAFTIGYYEEKDGCLKELYKEQVHTCIVPSESFLVDGSPTGALEIYYDNSRAGLAPFLTNYFQERLSAISEDITTETAVYLLSQLNEILQFLDEGGKTLEGFSEQTRLLEEQTRMFAQQVTESQEQFEELYEQLTELNEQITQSDFEDVPEQLAEIKETLDESLLQVREAQELLAEASEHFDESRELINETIDLLEAHLPEDSSSQELLASIYLAREQMSAEELEDARRTVDDMELELLTMKQLLEDYEEDVLFVTDAERKEEFEQIYTQASTFRTFLNISSQHLSETLEVLVKSREQTSMLAQELHAQKQEFHEVIQIDIEEFVAPLATRNIPLLPSANDVYLLFPQYLLIILIFISILFSNIILLGEIYSSAQLRGFVLPVAEWVPLAAYYVTNLFIIGFQLLILLLVAQLAFDVSIMNNILPIAITIFLLSSLCILIGMVAAYLTDSKENSILLTTFVAVAMFLASNFLIPTALMTKTVSTIVSFNPMVLADTILRRAFFFDVPLFDSLTAILLLLLYVVVLAGLLFLLVHLHRHSYN